MNDKKNISENEPQVIMPYGYMPCHPPEEDEIDLRELWRVLARRKWTIFATMGVAVALTLVYLWMATPVFEAKALMQIGSIQSKLIDTPSNLKMRLERIYHVNDKNVKKEYPNISAISIPKNTSDLIQLTAQGLNNKNAEDIIVKVCKEIESKHEKIILSYIDLKKHYLLTKKSEADHLQKQIEQLSKNLKTQDDLLNNIIKEDNIQEASVLAMAYSDKLDKLTALQNFLSSSIDVINQIELSLLPINIKKTRMVGQIATYDHPVKPKKKLMIAVSLVAGLMLGVFLAFFFEFIGKKEE